MSREGRHARLRRLAERVSVGEAVFFIGAGFSLDAEGNSAKALIARLLVRFEALCDVLRTHGRGAARTRARVLQHGLRNTFKLVPWSDPGQPPAALFDDAIDTRLGTLAQNYYLVNDWLCSAFDELLGFVPPVASSFEAALAQREEALAAQLARHEAWAGVALRIGRLDLALLLPFRRHCSAVESGRPGRALAGKLLFLETMGFADPAVMAGSPMDPDLRPTLDAIRGKLSERHETLARLGAEGLCPVVVTTNFDLLLESAYRLAGLVPWNPPPGRWRGEAQFDGADPVEFPRNDRFNHFTRIAEVWQFFDHSRAARSVHLYKIHGCADAYRLARRAAAGGSESGHAVLRQLLPSIVFTYREIQNWRGDTWSRDHLNTLLRTRTIVFSGYSVADPVIHDTFRTIYEEMADLRLKTRAGASAIETVLPTTGQRAGAAGAAAPSFVIATEPEFHGMQILRAASQAAGERGTRIDDHRNLLTFRLRHDEAAPTLDELFVALAHECQRGLQSKALDAQLTHTHYRLVGRRPPHAEVQAIRDNFDALREWELREAARLLDDPDEHDDGAEPARRAALRALTGWTWHFHAALMREYALAEDFLRRPGDPLGVDRIARLPWYAPASEHADWCAWGVVIELAVRRAFDAVARPGGVAAPAPPERLGRLEAARCGLAAFAFDQRGVRRALVIGLEPMRRSFARVLPRPLRALAPIHWPLGHETVPWWREGDPRRPLATPSAATLWQWAALPPAQWAVAPDTVFTLPEVPA